MKSVQQLISAQLGTRLQTSNSWVESRHITFWGAVTQQSVQAAGPLARVFPEVRHQAQPSHWVCFFFCLPLPTDLTFRMLDRRQDRLTLWKPAGILIGR